MALAIKKPQRLTLLEKSRILEALNKGATLAFLSDKYGLAKSTICAIKTKKERILKAVSESASGLGQHRSLKCGTAPVLERELFKWISKQRENRIPVSGAMIKEMAKELHKKQVYSKGEFNASVGWLRGFKKRYGMWGKVSSQPKLKSKKHTKIEKLKCNDDNLLPVDVFTIKEEIDNSLDNDVEEEICVSPELADNLLPVEEFMIKDEIDNSLDSDVEEKNCVSPELAVEEFIIKEEIDNNLDNDVEEKICVSPELADNLLPVEEFMIKEEIDNSLNNNVQENFFISPELAIESLNLVIDWSEEQGVNHSDILVLKRLRERAVSLNLNK